MGKDASLKLRQVWGVISSFALLALCGGMLLLLLPLILVGLVHDWSCWLIRKRGAMFLYETSLRSGGEEYRPGDSVQAKEKFNSFRDKYFERVAPDKPDGILGMMVNLNWKITALPNAEWPKRFLKSRQWGLKKRITFMLTEDHITCLSGIVFPIPLKEPASYNFLREFSSETPFKMSVQHFRVVIPKGKSGRYSVRTPDADILARLNEVI